MDQRNVPWKAEWKAAGVDPGPLSAEEEALVLTLQLENEAFLQKHPFVKRTPQKPQLVPFSAWTVPLVAAAALVVLLGVPWTTVTGETQSLERMKGTSEPELVVYRQAASGNEKLVPQTIVHPGDVLQVAYRVPQGLQGAILSVDGSGNVTTHLARQGRSVALTGGSERPLDFGYELDRAPRFEVFFLLVSQQSFDLESIRQTLKATPWNQLKPGAFGPSIQFAALPLNKEVN